MKNSNNSFLELDKLFEKYEIIDENATEIKFGMSNKQIAHIVGKAVGEELKRQFEEIRKSIPLTKKESTDDNK